MTPLPQIRWLWVAYLHIKVPYILTCKTGDINTDYHTGFRWEVKERIYVLQTIMGRNDCSVTFSYLVIMITVFIRIFREPSSILFSHPGFSITLASLSFLPFGFPTVYHCYTVRNIRRIKSFKIKSEIRFKTAVCVWLSITER